MGFVLPNRVSKFMPLLKSSNKRNEIIRNTKDSFGNPISKKLFKMPKEAKVTSLARKSRIAEKKTKDYEYKNANKPEVA